MSALLPLAEIRFGIELVAETRSPSGVEPVAHAEGEARV
jgi:hypothetical protein